MAHKNDAWRALRHSIGLLVAALTIGALAASGQVARHGKSRAAAAKSVERAQITAVNAATGLVTARVKATQKTVQFNVNDKAVLQSLKVGKSINVEKGTGQVFQSGRGIGSLTPRIRDTYGNGKADCIRQHNRTGLNCVISVSQNYTNPGSSTPADGDEVEYECRCS